MDFPTCLIFWDADGNVVGTLDHMVKYDEDGKPLGLVDFEAQELSGGRLRDIVEVSNAVGAGTWPEWLGSRAMDFKVELRDGSKGGTHMIKSLVHKKSGFKRERSEAKRKFDELFVGKGVGDIVDARRALGGPETRLEIDDDGMDMPAPVRSVPELPLRKINGDGLGFVSDVSDESIKQVALSGLKPAPSIDPRDVEALAKLSKKS